MSTETDLKTPAEWARLDDCLILDADGWNGRDPKPFDEPITQAEYEHRRAISTCRFPASYDQADIDRLAAKRAAEDGTARWIDKQGDIWTLGTDGLLHTPETAPFTLEQVQKKWGPLKPIGSDAAAQPATDRDPILEAALIAAGHTTLHGNRNAQMRAAIDAVTPLIRQQVAEEIAVRADQIAENYQGSAVAHRDLSDSQT